MLQQHADLQELRRLRRLQLGGDRRLVAEVFADVDRRFLLIEHQHLGRAEGLGVGWWFAAARSRRQIAAVERGIEAVAGVGAGDGRRETDGLQIQRPRRRSAPAR